MLETQTELFMKPPALHCPELSDGLGSPGTQLYDLYELLRRRYPDWTPLSMITPVTKTKHTARISKLRKILRIVGWTVGKPLLERGYDAEGRPTIYSWYRLERFTEEDVRG